MAKVTYNITTDKLIFAPDARLSDAEYQAAKAARFVFWPSRKVFAATWSTQSEDFILSLGCEIEADDTPDDLEGRVERFQGYAEAAEMDAERSALAVSGLNVDGTERTKPMTARRTEITLAHVAKASEEALHWQRRIEGAIRHAAKMDDPGVIARRIEKLEAEKRKFERESKLQGSSGIAYDVLEARDKGKDVTSMITAHVAWAQRWIDHIAMRLEYERAYLAAVGGSPDAGLAFEVGGMVKWHGYICQIEKVNPKTIRVNVLSMAYPWYLNLNKTEIKESLSEDEFRWARQYQMNL